MSTTYQASVEDYCGTQSDTQMLSNVLSAGAKFIVNAIPESKLDKYASNNTDTGSGIDVSAIRIVRAHKDGYNARQVSPKIKLQVLPSGAIGSVSVTSPGSGYVLGDVLTLSQGTGGSVKVSAVDNTTVTAVTINTVGTLYTTGLKTTTVDSGTGIGCEITVTSLASSSIHQATLTDPVFYVENTKGYVIPSGGTIIGVSYPDVAYGDDPASKPTGFPPELKHGIVLYAVIQILLGKANTAYDAITSLSMDSVSAPTPPNAASFSFSTVSYTDAVYSVAAYSAGTFTPPSFTPATIDTTSATTIGAIPTPPTYTKPTTSFSLTNAGTYISTDEDLSKGQVEIQKQNALLEQFGKDQYNELNNFNSLLENQKLAVQKLFDQAQLDQQRLIDQSQKVVELNKYNATQTINTALENAKKAADVAIANNQNSMAVDIQNKAKALEVDIQNRMKSLEADIVNKTKTAETAIQQYQSNLENYQAQLSAYGNDINKAVQKYSLGISKTVAQLQGIAGTIEQCRKEFQMIMSNL